MDPPALKPKIDLERDLVRLKLVRRRREPRDKKWEEEKKGEKTVISFFVLFGLIPP